MEEFLSNFPIWGKRILFVLVAIIIILIAIRVLTWIIIQPIKRIANRYTSVGVEIADALTPAIKVAVAGIGIIVAYQIVDIDSELFSFVDPVARSLLILSAFIAIFNLIDVLLDNIPAILGRMGVRIPDRLIPLVRITSRAALIVFAVLIVLSEWGVNITAFVASLGVLGLAFSLAAQEVVQNVIGFASIVGDHVFEIGDYIRTSDVSGIVEGIGMRSTRIRKDDRALVVVPNSVLAGGAIDVFQHRRINFTIGVTYETTAEEIEELVARLRKMLEDNSQVSKESIGVFFDGFGDSSLNIVLFCDVLIRHWRLFRREREQIYLTTMRIVAEQGLSIAFPTRSLYIENLPDSDGAKAD